VRVVVDGFLPEHEADGPARKAPAPARAKETRLPWLNGGGLNGHLNPGG
jgi:hypothetical protein